MLVGSEQQKGERLAIAIIFLVTASVNLGNNEFIMAQILLAHVRVTGQSSQGSGCILGQDGSSGQQGA